MIEPAKFLLFIGVSWALILAPGPDMLYVITRGIAHGRKAGILSAIGVVCGILIHTTTAAFGLTLVLQTSAVAFLLIKYTGAAYLIYLGTKSWRDKSTLSLQRPAPIVNSGALFWQGVLSNVLNPKIAMPPVHTIPPASGWRHPDWFGGPPGIHGTKITRRSNLICQMEEQRGNSIE